MYCNTHLLLDSLWKLTWKEQIRHFRASLHDVVTCSCKNNVFLLTGNKINCKNICTSSLEQLTQLFDLGSEPKQPRNYLQQSTHTAC